MPRGLGRRHPFVLWLTREIRRRGWSVNRAAAEIGYAQSGLNEVVNGIRVPSRETLLKISRVLEVPESFLVEMLEQPVDERDVAEARARYGASDVQLDDPELTILADELTATASTDAIEKVKSYIRFVIEEERRRR